MLQEKDQRLLRRLLDEAVRLSKEDVKPCCVYLDASDIWERCGDAPFADTLVYSAFELSLYRDGYHLTAKHFHALWLEEQVVRPRLFFEASVQKTN